MGAACASGRPLNPFGGRPVVFPTKYPDADQRLAGRVRGNGVLEPAGVTIHYSADRDAERTVRSLAERGLGYHVLIDRDGAVLQLAPFNVRLSHAGSALWRGLSPNRTHVSVCLISWGFLDKTRTAWNGYVVAAGQVAERPVGRFWDAATPPQEAALWKLLGWLCQAGIGADTICGHDECAVPAGRKVDPGGVLSITMGEIRARFRAAAPPHVAE